MTDDQIAELCCGPGGMALGFSSRFEISFAVDNEKHVVETYGANHPETQVRQLDIKNITGHRNDFYGITGVIGGPPCQGSSIINTKRCAEDPRNSLMMDFMRIVEEVSPRFFVMENVPGVPPEIKEAVVKAGQRAGYETVSKFLNASEYGAAQTRERWIVVGLKGKTWVEPPRIPAKTVRAALSGIRNNWGAMKSREDTLSKLALAIPGKWSPMNPESNFENMIKLSWDTPAPAVVNMKKVYMVHPDETRNITLAEAAALQGFPPEYRWLGTQTQIAQMIANAMPAEFAGAIARSIS